MKRWWPIVVVGLLAGALIGPTASEQYGAAAWRWIKLQAKTWHVSTADGLDEALAACATYEVPNGSGEQVGGRIVVTDWITKDCTGESGGCFELPSVAHGTDETIQKATCSLEFHASTGTASSVTGYVATPGIECDNTKDMTAESVNGESTKSCLQIRGDGQIVVNPTIVTSDGSDASTVGIGIWTAATAGLHCPNGAGTSDSADCDPGQRAIRNTHIENVTVRTEDITSSGKGIATAFALGGYITVNRISGYSVAGVDMIDTYDYVPVGTQTLTNSFTFIGGSISGNAIGYRCDEAYDAQNVSFIGTVMESNGINIHLDPQCSVNIEALNQYHEADKDSLFPGTSGIFIEGANSHLHFSGVIGCDLTDLTYGIRRTTGPAGRPDVVDAGFYCGVSTNYPTTTGGILLNGATNHGTTAPVDGTTNCEVGDTFLEDDVFKFYSCLVGGATDKWYGVQLVDTP